MLKPNEIEKFSTIFDKPMKALENEIMEDIVRRIKINGEITRSADWQMHRLYEMGMSKREIKKAVADNLNLSKAEIKHLYNDIIRKGYERDKSLYKAKGKAIMSFEENLPLQQLVSAVAEQTFGQMKNLSQSLGFAVKQPDGTLKFQEVANFYQQTLDNAIMGITSGTFDYVTAIKKAILTMTNSGLRTVDYATGWSNRTAVAARRAVVTGLSQITAKVNEDNAKALKTEYFEVTWHSGARPTHQEWQGKVYTRAQLETVCGLGTVTGLCGANCYHDYYPFIPGISERTYTDEQLEKLNAEDNKKREYQGKEYTKYEALQRQRHLETSIRAKREQIHLLEVAEVPEEDIINARCRYQGTLQEYNRFSREMDLPVQRDRIYVDGWENIGVGKSTKGVDKSGESDIIEFERAMAAKSFDKASEYARKKLKISISSLSELPLETVNAVNNSIEKLYKNVPSLFGIINEVLVDDINEIAKSSLRWIDGSPQIRLKLSRFYFANMSVEKIENIISELANDGVFTQKKGIYGIIQHEAVHLAEFKQTIKRYGGLRNDIEQSLDSFELAKELKELALHNCSLDDTDTIVISMLCSYATENPAEFLAEGYSSTVSNPLTDEIKRLLRKKWGM